MELEGYDASFVTFRQGFHAGALVRPDSQYGCTGQANFLSVPATAKTQKPRFL